MQNDPMPKIIFIPDSTVRFLWVCAILVAEFAAIMCDIITGPFLPFTLVYILLIYFSLKLVGSGLGYTVALFSAMGRTFEASTLFPSDIFALATIWQLVTAVSVYGLFCYLLDLQFTRRNEAENRLNAIQRAGDKDTANTAAIAEPVIDSQTDKTQARPLKISLAFAAISVLVVFSSLSADLIFSKTATQYLFDPPTGRVLAPPVGSHGSNVDGVVKKYKVLLLTIDDGPANPDVDMRILGILRKHAAPSIWFVNCSNFDTANNTNASQNLQSLRAIAKAGHMIGNHSTNHKDPSWFNQQTQEVQDLEIGGCSHAIHEAIGIRPTYYRAPWGIASPDVIALAKKGGMRNMNWTANSNDASFDRRSDAYRKYLFESPVVNFEDTVKDGDIVLLHDRVQTAEILDQLLTDLEHRGFRFVLPS